MIEVRLKAWHEDAVQGFDVALTEYWDAGWLDEMNGPGSGTVKVALTDPEIARIGQECLLLFKIDGVLRFTSLVESIEYQRVAPGEEGEEYVALSGRGWAAEWSFGIVPPQRNLTGPVMSERIYNFAITEFTEALSSPWVAASQIHQQQVAGFYTTSQPSTVWPDGLAYWIWSTATFPPADGTSYFRLQVNVGTAFAGTIYASGDDTITVWWNGKEIINPAESSSQFKAMQSAAVDVPSGNNTIGVRCKKLYGDRGAVILTLTSADPNTGVETVQTLWRTDSSYRALHSPVKEPGFTPYFIVDDLRDDVGNGFQTKPWTLTGSLVNDSTGTAWPDKSSQSFAVGTTLLGVLDELAALKIDWAASGATRSLHLWRKGATSPPAQVPPDAATAVTLAVGTNIARLEHRIAEPTPVTDLIATYSDKATANYAVPGVGLMAPRASLATFPGGFEQVADALIAAANALAPVLRAYTVTAELVNLTAAQRPYVGFGVGGTVTAPDRTGAAVTHRVHSISVTQDAEGNERYVLELGMVVSSTAGRRAKALTQAALGTLDGRL